MRELKGDWRDLFNGFMVALDLRKMFLALCGIFLTVALCGGLTLFVAKQIEPARFRRPTDLVLHKLAAAQCQAWHVIYAGNRYVERGGKVVPLVGKEKTKQRAVEAHPTKDIVVRGGRPSIYIPYSIAFVLIFIAIWSYFGGAIARIAAYEIAKDGERIETRKALHFSRRKFWSFFWAPLICVIGFLFFAFCNYAGGFVGKVVDVVTGHWAGAPLVALLLPLALLSGFIMTLIAVGTMTGFPLFTPAVAAEGTDSFDAVSRGFSYVYSRPWHYLGYQAVSAVYGYVCIAFVILFAIAMCHLGIATGGAGFELCGAWGPGEFKAVSDSSWNLILSDTHDVQGYSWDPREILAGPHPYGRLQALANAIVRPGDGPSDTLSLTHGHSIALFLMTLWLVVTLGLALGYVISYFISQQTMIYYVLRKKVDGIEMNEVFEETEEEPPSPAEAPKAESKPAESPKEEKK